MAPDTSDNTDLPTMPETPKGQTAHVLMVDPGTNLGQALKLSGMVMSGGEAKVVISAGSVTVNGVRETRRGRKLAEGDMIQLNDATARVTVRDRETGSHSTG